MVFYAQSTITVVSGGPGRGVERQRHRDTESETERERERERIGSSFVLCLQRS